MPVPAPPPVEAEPLPEGEAPMPDAPGLELEPMPFDALLLESGEVELLLEAVDGEVLLPELEAVLLVPMELSLEPVVGLEPETYG